MRSFMESCVVDSRIVSIAFGFRLCWRDAYGFICMIDCAVWIEESDGEFFSKGRPFWVLARLGLGLSKPVCLELRRELKGTLRLMTPSASKSYISSFFTLLIGPLISGRSVKFCWLRVVWPD